MKQRVLLKRNGFTFIELILVLAIVAILFSLVGFRTGTFTFWKEEGFIRTFSETTRYLFGQAAADQVAYQLEIDLAKNTYRVGAMREENHDFSSLTSNAAPSSISGTNSSFSPPSSSSFGTMDTVTMSELGNLSLELAMILNPASIVGEDGLGGETLIPPPSFPSLYEPHELPNGMRFISVRTSRQLVRVGDPETKGYIYFASGGLSDFAAIELEQSSGQRVTFVVNPFTTQVDIYRDSQDIRFEDLFQMGPQSSQPLSSSSLTTGSN